MVLPLCLTQRSCSSARRQLARSLWAQLQKVLWASDGGDLGGDSTRDGRRAWNLADVICCMLQLGLDVLPPSQVTWYLGMCRKIHSRAISSEQNDWDPRAALRKVQHFRFVIVDATSSHLVSPSDPAWSCSIKSRGKTIPTRQKTSTG
ncbi:hypothetical protein BDR05DRAFT_59272 [Suillus weaverae]|nr:hypothetical protein BDR05DRAFT_59272 [Suillus weaverae]